MRHFGIRFKFIAVILLVMVGVTSFFTYRLLQSSTKTLRQNMFEQADSFSQLATKPIGDTFLIFKDSGHSLIQQQMSRFADLSPIISNIAITDLSGSAIVAMKEQPNQISSAQAETFETIVQANPDGTVDRIIVPFLEDTGAHRYTMVYTFSSDHIQAVSLSLIRSSIIYGVVAFMFSAGLLYALMNRLFVKPVQSLSRAALAISAGNLDQKIGLQRQDELGRLAQAVNHMADILKADIKKLQEVDRLKTEFMVIASHNLRTPLTVISGYIEMLNSMPIDDKIQKFIKPIAMSARQLRLLAEDMLTISSMEAGNGVIPKEPLKLQDMLQNLAEETQALAEQKEVIFESNTTKIGQLNIKGSRAHLYNALWNILENAVKFTSPKKHIKLTAEIEDSQVIIKVSDEGIGIPAEELPKLFTKFHRGTDLMKYEYDGAGVGLYVTKLIIEEHGGNINLVSQPGKGTVATIKLPSNY